MKKSRRSFMSMLAALFALLIASRVKAEPRTYEVTVRAALEPREVSEAGLDTLPGLAGVITFEKVLHLTSQQEVGDYPGDVQSRLILGFRHLQRDGCDSLVLHLPGDDTRNSLECSTCGKVIEDLIWDGQPIPDPLTS